MSLVTESLQNPKMGISFRGKNWIPSLWNKADSYSRNEQICMNTSRAGHGYKEMWLYVNSVCWRAFQLLMDIVWSVVSDQPFVFKHSCERAESVLVSPLYGPTEDWVAAKLTLWDNFLHAFPSFLCSGRKHKTMILDRIPLQGTLVPQWLMWYNKKDTCCSIYYMGPLSRRPWEGPVFAKKKKSAVC